MAEVQPATERRCVAVPPAPRLADERGLPGLFGRAMRYAVAVIIFVQTMAGLGGLSNAMRVLAVGLSLVSVAVWVTLTTRRQGDLVDSVLLAVAVGLGAWLGVLTGNGQVFVTGYAALFVAPFWYGLPNAVLPSVSGIAAVTFFSMFAGRTDVADGIGNGLGVGCFGLAALFWGRVLRASERNAQLVDELQESREAEHRSAILAERARLARELHDVLAHTLSSLSLHLESTRVLAKSRDVDDEVVARIERAVALTRNGLVEAREAVGTLRDDELPGPERLASLVDDFQRSTGVECRFEERGAPLPLAPEARIALVRGAQEALTNVGKHAAATHVDVCLDWDVQHVTLRVVDDGRGTDGAATLPGGGNGLRGMRERAELAGGQVDAGPTGRGFAVELRLPA